MSSYRITVFTPTYNRGYIIEKLYHSLQRQTYRNFEWVVVDDGSSDNTEDLFERWISSGKNFPIKYRKVENGGKHRAINYGIKMAQGELFFIVDSDDYLTDDALEIIDKVEKSISTEDKKEFCGVCGLKGYTSAKSVGTSFVGDYIDINSLQRNENGITGDKSEVFYSDIMAKYPFPEYDGEKFVTEALVWDRMAHDGLKLRYFNDIIYICDYLDDGLTNSGLELYARNPKAWGAYINQSIAFGKTKGIEIWNDQLRFYYNMRNRLTFFEISHCLNKNPFVLWIQLLGVRLFYKLYRIN